MATATKTAPAKGKAAPPKPKGTPAPVQTAMDTPTDDPIRQLDALMDEGDEDQDEEDEAAPLGMDEDEDETPPDDLDDEDEDEDEDEELDEDEEEEAPAPAPAAPAPAKGKKAPAAPAPVAAPAKAGTIRTSDGKTVEVKDASPVNITEEDDELAKKKEAVRASNLKAREEAERALAKLDEKSGGVPAVRSFLQVFKTGEQVALQGVRNRIETFSEADLKQIDETARTAEATGWRMACAVRREIVVRLRKGVEERAAKISQGIIEPEKVAKNLTARIRKTANDMGISARELYNSAQIEETYFHKTHLDDDGNEISLSQIEDAITILKDRSFLQECLRLKADEDAFSPGYGLVLMAEKKLAMPRYSTRDARIDVNAMKAGTYGLSEDAAQRPEDLEGEEEGEVSPGAVAASGAGDAARIGDIKLPNVSGACSSLVNILVRAARRLQKNGTGVAYVYQDERGVWTAGTDAPKPLPGQKLSIFLTVEPDNVYFSAELATGAAAPKPKK